MIKHSDNLNVTRMKWDSFLVNLNVTRIKWFFFFFLKYFYNKFINLITEKQFRNFTLILRLLFYVIFHIFFYIIFKYIHISVSITFKLIKSAFTYTHTHLCVWTFYMKRDKLLNVAYECRIFQRLASVTEDRAVEPLNLISS